MFLVIPFSKPSPAKPETVGEGYWLLTPPPGALVEKGRDALPGVPFSLSLGSLTCPIFVGITEVGERVLELWGTFDVN